MERNETTTAEDNDDDWNTTDIDTIMIPNSQPSPTTGAYYPMPTQNLSNCDDLDDFLSTNQNRIPGDGDFYGLQNQDLGAAYMKQPQLLDCELPSDVSLMNISSDGVDMDAYFRSCTNMNEFYFTSMPNLPDDDKRSHTDCAIYRKEGDQNVMEDEKIDSSPPIGRANGFEDGYNWRKYGQKQVKGSECPRSYYKCTNPTCEAKKKVERARKGNLTKIIYNGAHNHPMPLPNRRFVNDETDTVEDYNSHANIEGGSAWMNMNSLSEDDRVCSLNWRSEGLEDRELAKSVLSQLSIENPPDNKKHFNPLESAENEEVPSPPYCQYADDGVINETDTKRRRTDDCMVEPNMASIGIRQDKIMVQAESEIDIIDDGYRWRKYGQKVVKGNPNPRSYYKCTSAGCLVRKHIERNPQNIKDVITTYEGRHNHEVPPAKNSSNPNKNVGNLPSVPFTGQASHMSLTRSSTLPMPGNFSPHFQRTSFPGNELLYPGLIGNFGTGMSFRGSSTYHSGFPMPYGSLEQNIPNLDIAQVGRMTSNLVNQRLLTIPGSLNTNMIPDFNIGVGGTDHQLAPGHDFDAMRTKTGENGPS